LQEVALSEVPIASARAHLSARLLDLSLGGALLALGSSLEIGAVHEFALDLDGQTVKVRGQVRHCRPADRYTGYHVGVSFVGIDPHDEQRLGEYLGGH
jgi:c-di-GMP-binding flagellar brake protein YcgR